MSSPQFAFPSQASEDLKNVFLLHLLEQYRQACTQENRYPGPDHLIRHLMRHNLFSDETLRHYTVLHEFKASFASGKYRNKTQTITALAERFDIHENTIWNILKDHKHKFEPRPHTATSLQVPSLPDSSIFS